MKTFIEMVEADLRDESTEDEQLMLESNIEQWRLILKNMAIQLEQSLVELKRDCLAMGKEGKKKWERDRYIFSIPKTRVQRRLSYLNLIISEKNLSAQQSAKKTPKKKSDITYSDLVAMIQGMREDLNQIKEQLKVW